MMFIHALTITRTSRDYNVLDERGQPTTSGTVVTSVYGLVQPRRVREMLDAESAGSEIGDHVIFIPIGTDLQSDDYITYGTDRYQVTGIRRFDFGALAHIEVDARLITAVPA